MKAGRLATGIGQQDWHAASHGSNEQIEQQARSGHPARSQAINSLLDS